METKILQPTEKNIEICALEIVGGGIVAFPTETVYGLGASIYDVSAVKKIYEAKGRPSDNPLIVHISDLNQISKLAENVPEKAYNLFELMPGPITLVLKKNNSIPDCVTGGLDTVGIRMPAHEVALKFIEKCGTPICAPSANLSTSPSPTEARHVYNDLNGRIKYILDGGRCYVGLESTIVDFSSEKPRILRKGGVPVEVIEKRIGKTETIVSSEKALCPGMKYKHYSPKAKVIYCNYGQGMSDIIRKKYDNLDGKKQIFCMSDHLAYYLGYDVRDMGKNDAEYAYELFSAFRDADKSGYDYIIMEGVEDKGIGSALINRAVKASGGNIINGTK